MPITWMIISPALLVNHNNSKTKAAMSLDYLVLKHHHVYEQQGCGWKELKPM